LSHLFTPKATVASRNWRNIPITPKSLRGEATQGDFGVIACLRQRRTAGGLIKRKAPITSNAFGMAMRALGYVAPRTMKEGKRGRWYTGLALNGNREPVKVGF
jgi:hypothetical protein